MLDIQRQHIAGAGSDGVRAGIRAFRDHVARTVDDIGVVTRTAHQGVVARTAVKRVVGGVAGNDVVAAIARGVDGREPD